MARKMLVMLLLVSMLSSLFSSLGINHHAFAALPSTIRILEITDSGSSDLTPLGPSSNYSIETMSMKKFVSLRTDIDGKYDAIYIGKGQYNTQTLGLLNDKTSRENASKSQGILNDITALKAGQIVNSYINKGLLVLLYSDQSSGLLYQVKKDSKGNSTLDRNGILYKTFSPYNVQATSKSNVKFINENTLKTLFSSTLSSSTYISLLSQRPQLKLTYNPVDYSTNSSNVYSAGDTLTYNYTVGNAADFSKNGLVANLYLSVDQALKYSADQIVASSQVTSSGSGSLSYKLPKGYSGLYYWRFEVVDQSSKLKNYVSGTIRFRDKLTSVKVLQVMPNNDSNSSLKNQNVLNQNYLTTSDYKIQLDTTDFNTFNSTTYRTINGTYDMLIFGFRDEYNGSAGISDNAAKAVNSFIGTGQSVMFTHDTVYSGSGTATNNWIEYFQSTTGQTGAQTNIGYGAPIPSTSVTKINDGLLTQFPFNIGSLTTAVASTHDQYFMLNLEDESVIPWYNINGSGRDDTDSYNHYYTYSKGNVTYSGSGHVFTGKPGSFPDWEQKLFVNTMYRAYIGSNHAPDLTILSPTEYVANKDNYILNYQDVVVSFVPEDYDLTDRKLDATVTLKENNNVVASLPSFKVDSGSTVVKTLANPLPNGGNLTIEVTVTDKSGAKTTQSVNTLVRKVSSNLQVNRTVSGLTTDNKANTGSPLTLTYTAAPQPIAVPSEIDADRLFITAPAFAETFPANIEISGLPSGWRKSGTLASGYTVTGTLQDTRYTLNAARTQYEAPARTFTLTATPTVDGSYLLNNSNLTFKDIAQVNPMTLPFQTVVFESLSRITSLSITGTEMAVGDAIRLIPTYGPATATTPKFTWTSSNAAVASVNEIGTVNGVSLGSATITVQDSYSGLSASAVVNVIPTGLTITGASIMNIGESQDLKATLLKTTGETVTSKASWTIATVGGSGKATVVKDSTENGSPWSTKLTATEAGTVKLTATVIVSQPGSTTPKTYSSTFDVQIINAKIQLNGPSTVIAGATEPYTVAWATDANVPQSIKNSVTYQWQWVPDATSSTTRVSQTTGGTTGSLITNASDSGKLIVSAIWNGVTLATAEQPVTVIDKPGITGPDTVTIGTNNTLQLSWPTGVTPPSYTATWTIAPSQLADLSGSGNGSRTLIGNTAGIATINVTLTTQSGQRISLQPKTVTVVGAALQLDGYEKVIEGDTIRLTAGFSDSNLPQSIKDQIKFDWKWLPDNGNQNIATLPSVDGYTNDLKTKTSGTGKVRATAKLNGTEIATIEKSITIVAKPTITDLNTILVNSDNNTIRFDWPDGITASNYTPSWSIDPTNLATLSGSGNSNTVRAGSNTGTVTVTVRLTTQSGQIINLEPKKIIIVSANLALQGRTPVIAEEEIELVASFTDNNLPPSTKDQIELEWDWLPDNGNQNMATLPKVNKTTNTLSTKTSGTGKVKVTAKLNGAVIATIEKPITIVAKPTITAPKTILIGGTNTLRFDWPAGITASDYTTAWSINPNTGLATLSGSGNSNTITAGRTAGTVKVIVRLTRGGQTIQLESSPIQIIAPTFTLNGITTVVAGDTVSLQPVWTNLPSDTKNVAYKWVWTPNSQKPAKAANNAPSEMKSALKTDDEGQGQGTLSLTPSINGIPIPTVSASINVIGRPTVQYPAFVIIGATATSNLSLNWPKDTLGNNSTIGFNTNWPTNNEILSFSGSGNNSRSATGSKVGSASVQVAVTTDNNYLFKTAPVKINVISLNLPDQLTIQRGNTGKVNLATDKLTVMPSSFKNNVATGLTWTSTNPNIVTVDPKTGIITGNKKGTATITMIYQRDSVTYYSESMNVTVTSGSGDKY